MEGNFCSFPGPDSLLVSWAQEEGQTGYMRTHGYVTPQLEPADLSEPLFLSPVSHLHCFLLQEASCITPPQDLLQGGASQTTLTLLLTLAHSHRVVKMEKTLWVFSSTRLCFHQVNEGSASSGLGLLFLLFYFIFYLNSLFIKQY